MERNIKERVSQQEDENKVNENLTQFFKEKIVNRKAMFIPITGVATFMLVGYAAADTKAPEITSDQIEVPYGEKFDVDTVDVTQNRAISYTDLPHPPRDVFQTHLTLPTRHKRRRQRVTQWIKKKKMKDRKEKKDTI